MHEMSIPHNVWLLWNISSDGLLSLHDVNEPKIWSFGPQIGVLVVDTKNHKNIPKFLKWTLSEKFHLFSAPI